MSSVARQFLEVLFAQFAGQDLWIEFVGIYGGAPGVRKSEPRSVCVSLAEAGWLDQSIDICDQIGNDGENVYVGPAPRTRPSGPGHPRSVDDDVAEVHVLWADADPPKGEDGLPLDPSWKAKWRQAFEHPPLPPSMRVDSGCGYHIYYFLEKPAGRDAVKALMARICDHVPDGDPAVKNPSRIMRVPGYWHVKDPKNPIKTALDWAKPDLRYSLSAIDQAFPEKKRKPKRDDTRRLANTDGGVQTSARALTGRETDFLVGIWKSGERHALALAVSGAMRKCGWSIAEALAAVAEVVMRAGDDETRQSEVETTYRKDDEDEVAGWKDLAAFGVQPKDLPSLNRPFRRNGGADGLRTDQGNARAFVDDHKEAFRYAIDIDRWFMWDERRWSEKEAIGGIENAAKATTLRLLSEAYAKPDDDAGKDGDIRWALKSQSHGLRQAMLKTARTEPEVLIYQEQLDRDPFVLTVANGTLDLRTGELRPHRREDLITGMSQIAYDPKADCPRWENFLLEIFNSDLELCDFIHRAIGYSLTGLTREQCFFLMHGGGENGKSRFVEVLTALLGDFSRTASFKTFAAKENDNNVPNDLARLRGARLVTAVENEEGVHFSESMLKSMTGEDAVAARFLYGEWFNFKPTFKLWLAANHKPVIRGTDHAIWRRVRLIPFTVNFEHDPRKDKHLDQKLAAELPGILAWAARGTREWLEKGLGKAAAVDEATSKYRGESDLIGRFLGCDLVVSGPGFEVKAGDFYVLYQRWCEQNGERPVSGTKFGRVLSERGIAKDERKKGNVYLGYARADASADGGSRRYGGDEF